MKEKIVFSGGILVTPVREMQADLVIEGKTIQEIRSPQPPLPGEMVVDCSGLYIGPGLVDIHVHGGAGSDFVTDNPLEVINAVNFHLTQGTTSIVPSALSVPFLELERSLQATREAARSCSGEILGFHVEGVYLDMSYRGGHAAKFVHNPDPHEYVPFIENHCDFITEWTMAPELPGAIDLITILRDASIVPSAGHTQATYEDMMRAIEAGLRHTTHFACVMGNLHFQPLRETTGRGYAPGVVETILLHDELTTEVIADGFHLHPAIIRLAVKCKGPDRVCLVSDSMKGVGLPDGEYLIGGQECLVRNGIALIKDRPEVIASSVTPLSGMLRFAHQKTGLSLTDAWTMASLTPAEIIGFSTRKGSLGPGKDADLLLLDNDLQVKGVYAKGQKII